MRNLSAVFFVALAACGGGSDTPPVDSSPPQDTSPPPDTDPPPPDSQQLDLACAANTTPPTTATATVTVSGSANSLDIEGITPTVAPMADATIDSCINDCVGNNDKLDTTQSAARPCGQAGCDFTTGALDTPNDMPLDAYLKVSKAGHRTTNIFPSEPLRADLSGVPALAMTNGAFQAAQLFLNVTQQATNGALLVVVTDCALTPVIGSTLTVTQKGASVGEIVDASAFAEELAGTFIVFNVPEGDTLVGASVNGTDFRAHTIQSIALETSATQVTPGFAAP